MRPTNQWFDKFVTDTKVSLTAYVGRFASSREDAQEITQEAYLRVYRAMRKKSRDHEPMALLYTSARNIAISRLRHNEVVARTAVAVRVAEELRTDQRSTEQKAGDHQKMQSLLLVVNKLPPKCRCVFSLRVVDGLSQRDIAERLAISIRTVEKHLSRGMQLCRAELRALASSDEKTELVTAKRTGT